MKVIGYVRVSTDEQVREGASLEAQKHKITAWTESLDGELLFIAEDAWISGKLIRNRDGLRGAIEAACAEKAVLVIYSLSRLSRSTRDTLMLADKLDKAGADLVSLSERIDTTTAAGKMVFRMLAVLNEFERDQISERTSAILQHKKAKGEVYSPIPYGFRREGNKLIEDKKEQRVVLLIQKQKVDGYSLRKIASELNNKGIPAKRGGRWFPSTIRYLLLNSLHKVITD